MHFEAETFTGWFLFMSLDVFGFVAWLVKIGRDHSQYPTNQATLNNVLLQAFLLLPFRFQWQHEHLFWRVSSEYPNGYTCITNILKLF